MPHSTAIAVIAAFSLAPAWGAPGPKPAKESELEKLFGKPEDPSKRCDFKLDGKKLVIAVSEAKSDKLSEAPKTRREVVGDFEIEAVVSYAFSDRATGGHAGVGIAVWGDGPHSASVARYHALNPKGWEPYFVGESVKPDSTRHANYVILDNLLPAEPSRLKLRREKGVVTTWMSQTDGKSWLKLTEIEVKLPETVSVGVLVFGGLNAGFEATCDSLTITPLGKK